MPRRPSAIVRPVALVAMALGVLWVVACASPTLPLPPPEAPTQTVGTDADHIRLSAGCGGAQGGADIIIINLALQTTAPDKALSGSIASGCGAWDAIVFAHTGDSLSITQELGTVGGDPAFYTVR